MQWKRLIPAVFVIIYPLVVANEPDFRCKSGLVIPRRFVCDGEFDCGLGDESDEQKCSKHESLEENLSSEEMFVIDDVSLKLDQQPLEEGTTVEDNLHDDVSDIGKSWYKMLSRNTRTNFYAAMS